jgi:biopolymer transport protein TolR
MNNQRRSRGRRAMAEINVVPYIDVMLVLLIIFMVTTPLLTEGVKVNLPEAKAKTLAQDDKKPIVITVDAHGNYFLNIAADPKTAIAPVILANRIALEVQNGSNERPVLVKGDKQVPYEKVVRAMVLLQQAGVPEVGLVTDPSGAAA